MYILSILVKNYIFSKIFVLEAENFALSDEITLTPCFGKKGKVFPNPRGSVIARKWVPVKRFLPNSHQTDFWAKSNFLPDLHHFHSEWTFLQVINNGKVKFSKKRILVPIWPSQGDPMGSKWVQILFFA